MGFLLHEGFPNTSIPNKKTPLGKQWMVMMRTKQKDIMQQHLAQNSVLQRNNSNLGGYGNGGLASMKPKTILNPTWKKIRKRGWGPKPSDGIQYFRTPPP